MPQATDIAQRNLGSTCRAFDVMMMSADIRDPSG
jgi:hypothetical protein